MARIIWPSKSWRTVVLCVVVFGCSASVGAQTVRSAVPYVGDRCEAFRVDEDSLNYRDPRMWSAFVRACPDGPQRLRDSVARWRVRPDPVVIFIEEYASRAVRDGGLADVALGLMADAAAPELARLGAMSILKAQRYPPSRLLKAALLDPAGCIAEADWRAYANRRDVAPLATDLWSRVLQQALAITRAPTGAVSPRLRETARCLMSTALLAGGRVPVDPQRVQLTYLCGNRFRIRNSNPHRVSVVVDVDGTTERDVLPVPGAFADPFLDVEFLTIERGTVRMFLDGRQIDVKANGNRPCTN